jgi:hypothetical protein
LTGLLVGSQSVSRIAIGSSLADNHPTTKNYLYVHNRTRIGISVFHSSSRTRVCTITSTCTHQSAH